MKKVGFILTLVASLFVSLISNAQQPEDYFLGDWDVVVEGTPNGDAKMTMHLERVDGKLKGEMRTEGDAGVIKIEKIDEKETSLSMYYFAGGYDISMDFDKVDKNNIKGNLLGMFTARGIRKLD
ncbi:hypothetical protein [Maribellus maritimus]|uniref:hypothetical protein n=1 Tax=Maribellus maritimus TaxID=2870838 RepID=UPI001EEA8E2E|nr:hypothetical protein [Maribellus maritimus]MCG6190359.1 hypothetical protein [Maribellus maritimus]